MKTSVLIAALAFSGEASATNLVDCAYIEKAYDSGAFANIDFMSERNQAARKSSMLRQVEQITGLPRSQDWQPIFHTLVMGAKVFQTVDVALGDNPYVYFFRYDGAYLYIESRDGSTYVGGVFCNVPVDIFN